MNNNVINATLHCDKKKKYSVFMQLCTHLAQLCSQINNFSFHIVYTCCVINHIHGSGLWFYLNLFLKLWEVRNPKTNCLVMQRQTTNMCFANIFLVWHQEHILREHVPLQPSMRGEGGPKVQAANLLTSSAAVHSQKYSRTIENNLTPPTINIMVN